ncbi:MAG: hypothetical protein Q9160_005503 [Pyrenula sp. 1 TL-2023]
MRKWIQERWDKKGDLFLNPTGVVTNGRTPDAVLVPGWQWVKSAEAMEQVEDEGGRNQSEQEWVKEGQPIVWILEKLSQSRGIGRGLELGRERQN